MITRPTLFIDETKCKENIQRMFSKAQALGLDFRPHFKTHQSLEIGRWFKEAGTRKITVSSVIMAEYFASEWDDITIAFPVNLLEIDPINDLAKRIRLNLCIENVESVAFLSKRLKHSVSAFLKMDVGYHRTGIDSTQTDLIDKILDRVDASPLIDYKGFLGHAGHSYACQTREAILRVHGASRDIMTQLKARYRERYPDLILSLGDTPCCSVAEDFAGVDEIRPGNFVFYDLTQHQIGSNAISQIALALACPIVAIQKERSEIVIYGGGVHFCKDRLEAEEGTLYGRVVEKSENSWGDLIPQMYVKSLSQEHGIVSVPQSQIDRYEIGDYLMILPVHSCMTANSMKSYRTFDGRNISMLVSI